MSPSQALSKGVSSFVSSHWRAKQAGICFLVSIEWRSSPVGLITSIIAGWRELGSRRSWWSLAPPGCGALRCRRTDARYEKARTSPSAHVLSRLTLNNGMIGMGINKNWPIAPGWADQHAAIAQPVYDMLAGNYTDRTVIC